MGGCHEAPKTMLIRDKQATLHPHLWMLTLDNSIVQQTMSVKHAAPALPLEWAQQQKVDLPSHAELLLFFLHHSRTEEASAIRHSDPYY